MYMARHTHYSRPRERTTSGWSTRKHTADMIHIEMTRCGRSVDARLDITAAAGFVLVGQTRLRTQCRERNNISKI